MKNILQIMDYAAPYKGNFIRSIYSLEEQINREGGRQIYLFPMNARNFEWIAGSQKEGKHIYFIDNSLFSKRIRYSNIKLIKEIIKNENINIIHTHFVAYNYTLVLIKLLFARDIYIIGHFHNTFLPPKNLLRQIKILVVRLTYDLIIGVSHSVAESIIKAGIRVNKVTWISNAIDFKRLDNFEQVQLAKDENQKVVLIFGWPFHRKGVDIILDAIKQLNEENNNILLAISLAGGNEIFEKEIFDQLSCIPLWVKMLKPRDDVASYYNAANIFLSAGREEGMNYSVIEAAYCNCSIIASEIPGNPKEIPYQLRYQAESISELKESILILLGKSKTDLAGMKTEQKEFVRKFFDLDIWAERMVDFYRT